MIGRELTNFIRSLTLRVLAKTAVVVALLWSVPLIGGKAGPTEQAVETIVFIRHGEKPEGGFGQLNCQGLNRALALAPIIAKSFGRPDAIFARERGRRQALQLHSATRDDRANRDMVWLGGRRESRLSG